MKQTFELLLADGVIDEVIGQLKTGKEAEVWLVRRRDEILAAKLYKERHHRQFRNNASYKEGRKVRNSRTQRALAKGSRFGKAAAEEAWKSTEADALYKLHALGVRVPKPEMFYEGALLMEVVVDAEGHPAPRLMDAHLLKEAARPMYEDLRSQVVKMLMADLIHGDLSPFNVLLAWNGPTIIDFPQVVAAAHNTGAESFFKRDLNNLQRFFASIDPSLDQSRGDAAEIWRAYVRRDLGVDFVPSGLPPPPEAKHPQRAGGHPGGERRPHHSQEPRSNDGRAGQSERGGGGRPPRHQNRHRSAPQPEVLYRGEVKSPVPAGGHASPPPGSGRALPGAPHSRRRRRRR